VRAPADESPRGDILDAPERSLPWKKVGPGSFDVNFALPLLEKSGLILFRFDTATRQSTFSETSRRLLGYTNEELAADPGIIAGSLHPESMAEIRGSLEAHEMGGADQTRVRLRMRAKDASDIWV